MDEARARGPGLPTDELVLDFFGRTPEEAIGFLRDQLIKRGWRPTELAGVPPSALTPDQIEALVARCRELGVRSFKGAGLEFTLGPPEAKGAKR